MNNNPYGHNGRSDERLVEKDDYFLTVRQEYYCWLRAAGVSERAAGRAVMSSRSKRPKLKARISELKELHDLGKIDLEKGPWYHYGIDVGNPGVIGGKGKLHDYGSTA